MLVSGRVAPESHWERKTFLPFRALGHERELFKRGNVVKLWEGDGKFHGNLRGNPPNAFPHSPPPRTMALLSKGLLNHWFPFLDPY